PVRRALRGEGGANLLGLRVAVSWAYAPSCAKPLSVPEGLPSQLPRFGMDVVGAHPPGWRLMPQVMKKAEEAASQSGGSIRYTEDMDEAFAGADVVYPKSWGNVELFTDAPAGLA